MHGTNNRIDFQRAVLLVEQGSFSYSLKGLVQQSLRISSNCSWLLEHQWMAWHNILIGLNLLCPFEKTIWLGVSEFKLASFW